MDKSKTTYVDVFGNMVYLLENDVFIISSITACRTSWFSTILNFNSYERYDISVFNKYNK